MIWVLLQWSGNMLHQIFLCGCLAAFFLCSFAPCSARTDDGDEASDERDKRLMEMYLQQAKDWRIGPADGAEPFELVQEPVFKWLNSARVGTPRVQHGAVYVWTRQGRAEAIGTVFSQRVNGAINTYFYHELHSLSSEPIEGRMNGALQWTPETAGVKPVSFPKAPKVAESRRLRLVQMRQLARRFSAYSINYDDKRWGLSLLPQPLYRVSEDAAGVLDGVVFALMSDAGTDPEIILVIEAQRKAPKSPWTWHYTVCRFTDLKTFVQLDGEEVWSFANGSTGSSTDSGRTSKYRFMSLGSLPVGSNEEP